MTTATTVRTTHAWPTPGQYAWPDSLTTYIAEGGKLTALEPWTQIWLGELVRDVSQKGARAVRAMTYTPHSGRTADEKRRKVIDAHSRALVSASDRVRPYLERLAAREEAFTRWEDELLAVPQLVMSVSAQLSPRLDTIVSKLAGS